MRTKLLLTLSILLGFVGLALGMHSHAAHADPVVADAPNDGPYREIYVDAGVDAEPAVVAAGSDAGSAVVTTTTTTTIAPLPGNLHNPVDNPVAAFDDAKQAKKQGWPLFLLTLAVLITAGLSRASERWPTAPLLKWFAANKTLIFVMAVMSAVFAAAYNALAQGGSGYAVGYAGLGALLLFIAPKPKAGATA